MRWQVYLTSHGIWSDILSEDHTFILARDVDGVNVFVVKDGQEQVRYV